MTDRRGGQRNPLQKAEREADDRSGVNEGAAEITFQTR